MPSQLHERARRRLGSHPLQTKEKSSLFHVSVQRVLFKPKLSPLCLLFEEVQDDSRRTFKAFLGI